MFLLPDVDIIWDGYIYHYGGLPLLAILYLEVPHIRKNDFSPFESC